MDINSLFPSKYVRAADLQGKEVTLTILKATLEKLGFGSDQETRLVVWFKGTQKGLVMNRTNAMTIAKLYSTDTDGWVGKRIVIFATQIRAFGKTQDAIRVKDVRPPDPKPMAQNRNAQTTEAHELRSAESEEQPNENIDDPGDILDEDAGDEEAVITPAAGLDDEVDFMRDDEENEPSSKVNPFEDNTPEYKRVFLKSTGTTRELIEWLYPLHKNGQSGPCSVAEYKQVCELLDPLVNSDHVYALSLICQSDISIENRPSIAVAKALFRYLSPTMVDKEGKEYPNPNYRLNLAKAISACVAVPQPA